MCPRLRVKGGSKLGGRGMGTLAGLLLGAVHVSLVAEAGVGARQVLAACIPTGTRVRALVYICKQSQPGQGCTGRSGTAAAATGDRGREQPRHGRVENGRRKARCLRRGCQVMGGPRGHMLLTPHWVHCRLHCSGSTKQGRPPQPATKVWGLCPLVKARDKSHKERASVPGIRTQEGRPIHSHMHFPHISHRYEDTVTDCPHTITPSKNIPCDCQR